MNCIWQVRDAHAFLQEKELLVELKNLVQEVSATRDAGKRAGGREGAVV